MLHAKLKKIKDVPSLRKRMIQNPVEAHKKHIPPKLRQSPLQYLPKTQSHISQSAKKIAA